MKKIIILFGALLFFSMAIFAQGTSLTIGSNQAKVGDTVLVPINGSGLNNVGSISLKINYNSAALNFIGIVNSPVTYTTNASGNQIVLGWFDLTAATPFPVANGKIADMKFIVSNASALEFNTGACEIIGENGNIITTTYNNGTVGLSPVRLTIPNLLAVAGNTISVPVKVQKFNSVGSISIKVNYNSSVLSFTNVSSTNEMIFTAGAANGVISIGWFDQSGNAPITLPDSSVLLNMNFTYLGGAAPITFNTSQCELLDGLGNSISGVLYDNGSINPLGGVPTISIGNVKAVTTLPVKVPVTVSAFNNIGAFSVKVSYNAAALTYTGISDTYNGLTITNNASAGVITLGWFDLEGNKPISIDNGVLANLNFTYAGGTNLLNFNSAACEILDGAGNILSGVIYSNGSVTPLPIPNVPNLLSPANSSLNQPTALDLSWGPVPDAASYRVQVSINDSFTSIVKDTSITGTSTALNSLLNNTQYFWRVSSSNVVGTSNYSTGFNFTTVVAIPNAPTLVTPSNGAVNLATSIALTWEAVTNAAKYIVQVASDSAFTNIVASDSNVASNSKSVASLLNSTKYVWRVKAYNTSGTGSWSELFSFTTVIAPPAVPSLVSPVSGAREITSPVNLTWATSVSATSYLVQMSTNENFSNLIFSDTLTSLTKKVTSSLNGYTKYFWRVKAINIGGASAYSTAYNFITMLNAPTLLSPINGEKKGYTAQAFHWSTISGLFPGYFFQLASDSLFSKIVYQDSTLKDASTVVERLELNKKYFWRVSAKSTYGKTPYSEVFNFTTSIYVGIGNDPYSLPDSYNMYQNYPNPFNPSTVIKYDIPIQGMVTVKIYDILGKEVRTLVNDFMGAGRYSVSFDASNLPSGIYLCSIRSNEFSSVKKLMLLK